MIHTFASGYRAILCGEELRSSQLYPTASLWSSEISLQAGERENSGCPLCPEQRRQHGHLYTSSKCEFMGCPFSPLVFPQSVQGCCPNRRSVASVYLAQHLSDYQMPKNALRFDLEISFWQNISKPKVDQINCKKVFTYY